MFVSDSRINIYNDIDTWVLVLYQVTPEDQATYQCHLNSDPGQKLAINLNVRGDITHLNISNISTEEEERWLLSIFQSQ